MRMEKIRSMLMEMIRSKGRRRRMGMLTRKWMRKWMRMGIRRRKWRRMGMRRRKWMRDEEKNLDNEDKAGYRGKDI